MTTLRRRYQIDVSGNDAQHARLAASTQFVTDAGDREWYGIDEFIHPSDLELGQAWLRYARQPTFGAVPGLRPVASPVGVAEAARTSGSGPVSAAAPESAANRQMRAAIERVIDGQIPSVQQACMVDCMRAVLNVMRCWNFNPYGIAKLRRVVERLWGFLPEDPISVYYSGIGPAVIIDRYRGWVGRGEWRVELAAEYNQIVRRYQGTRAGVAWTGGGDVVMFFENGARRIMPARQFVSTITDRTYEPGEVLFGLFDEYNETNFGCSSRTGGGVSLPLGCTAPTGECHSFWWQGDGSIGGNRMPSSNCPWRSAEYQGFDPGVGRSRLYAKPPLYWYWLLFYGPQPEFGGMSLIEWLGSMEPNEIIRAVRRDVVMRNASVVEKFGFANVPSIIGEAENQSLAARERQERQRGLVTRLFGDTAQTLNDAKTLGVIGLVGGAATTVGEVIASLLMGAQNTYRTDIYGQLCPTYVAFAPHQSIAGLTQVLQRAVQMPPNPQPGLGVSPVAVGTPVGTGVNGLLGSSLALYLPQNQSPPAPTEPQSFVLLSTQQAPTPAIRPPPVPQQSSRWPYALGTLVVAGTAAGTGYWWWRKSRRRRD